MRVDLTSAVRFDLPRGAVHTTASGLSGVGDERAVLVPVSVLAEALAGASNDARANVARALGTSIGKRAAARFGGTDGVRAADVESVVESLAAEVALAGLGALILERWGQALVVVLDGAPSLLREDGAPFFALLLEAALGAATSWKNRSPLHCMHLADDGDRTETRYLVASASSSERVLAWVSSGVSWADAIRRLQRDRGGR